MIYFLIFYLIYKTDHINAKKYYYGTSQSIFEFPSITFTDIETRIGVHNKCLLARHCLHLSGYFMACHTLNHSFTDSPSNLRLRKPR